MIVYALNGAVAISPIFQAKLAEPQPVGNPATGIRFALSEFSSSLDKPLAIFFDEADCLSG